MDTDVNYQMNNDYPMATLLNFQIDIEGNN